MTITRGHLRLVTEPEYQRPTSVHPANGRLDLTALLPKPKPRLVTYHYVGTDTEGRICAGRWLTANVARMLEAEFRTGYWRHLRVHKGDVEVGGIGVNEGEFTWWAES